MEQDIKKEAIIRRLDTIIGLLLDLLSKGEKRIEKNQMSRLRELGLTNLEIGKIFGKSAEKVGKQIYKAKYRERK